MNFDDNEQDLSMQYSLECRDLTYICISNDSENIDFYNRISIDIIELLLRPFVRYLFP